MIVRNEERCLARCLESVRGLVGRIIIMDTGSTDQTIAIAASYGAEVHRMEWPDSFASARNAALDKSDADWNLVLDADEWLVSGQDALGPRMLPPKSVAAPAFVGCVQITEAEAKEGEARRRSFIPRILPKGVRYQGKIHEQPIAALPHTLVPMHVGHDGYDAAQLQHKAGRNEQLLLDEIENSPSDAYLWYQLGRQYLMTGNTSEAANRLATSYNISNSDTPFRHGIIIYTILALRWAGRYDEALSLVDCEQDNWDDSPDFYFAIAELYLEWAGRNLEIAQDELLPVVEAAWLKCLQIGEKPLLNGSVEGSGSYRAADNLSNFYKVFGQTDKAAQYAQIASSTRQGAVAAL
jgi:glycosyltransferase involved in cell wall biosynthesis